jgi:hypothetical protein
MTIVWLVIYTDENVYPCVLEVCATREIALIEAAAHVESLMEKDDTDWRRLVDEDNNPLDAWSNDQFGRVSIRPREVVNY